MINYWTPGRNQEEWGPTIFSAGYKYENPLQGLVEYHINGQGRNFKYYSAPTATGPLKITEEKDGILTLVSMSGKYPKRDEVGENPEAMIEVSDGVTYYFDTENLKFTLR